MNYQQLISKTRYMLEDIREPYLFSDSELVDYIEKTLNYFLMETNLYPIEETVNVPANSKFISIPNSQVLLDIYDVFFDGVFIEQIDHDVANTLPSLAGFPKYYTFENVFKNVYFYPYPDADGVLSYKRSNGVIISSLSAPIPIPLVYHPFLIDGVLSFAYRKNDIEIASEEKSARHFELFEFFINKVKKNVLLARQAYNTKTVIPKGLL